MLILLSPAKSLDFSSPHLELSASEPEYQNLAADLIHIAKQLSEQELSDLMKISAELAKLNHQRFQTWSVKPSPDASRAAMFAFDGDVYDGLSAKTLNKKQCLYLQQHLRILSGLYGVLRPSDAIQPYRLEMGRPLANPKGRNLYAFWSELVTANLNKVIEEHDYKSVLNLASEEYFKVVNSKAIAVPIIAPVFEEYKNGNYKIISFFAKKARGMMARYCAENRISKVSELKQFNWDGYQFCSESSDESRWVFRRDQEKCI
jgi:cytoplasmic iron level regulating protein YaaA (DUF328/UPF0246 family)